jgi:hypothetical protein
VHAEAANTATLHPAEPILNQLFDTIGAAIYATFGPTVSQVFNVLFDAFANICWDIFLNTLIFYILAWWQLYYLFPTFIESPAVWFEMLLASFGPRPMY